MSQETIVFHADGGRTVRDGTTHTSALLTEPDVVALLIRGAAWSEASLLRLGNDLGGVTTSRRNPLPLRRIRPVTSAAAPSNTLSSRYGNGAFPLHTECAFWREPPTFIALLCENRGTGNRETTLAIPGRLSCSLWTDPWEVFGARPRFLCTVATNGKRGTEIRFDGDCMKPAARLQTGPVFSELTQHGIRWAEQDVLVLDNRRCLHGRGDGSSFDENRVLVRMLIGGRQWPITCGTPSNIG
jgi:hypothetical protein